MLVFTHLVATSPTSFAFISSCIFFIMSSQSIFEVDFLFLSFLLLIFNMISCDKIFN